MLTLHYLSRSDALLAGAADWSQAVADVRGAIALLSTGQAGMVAESVMTLGADPRNKAYGLPAYVGGPYDAAGLKWTVHQAESLNALPSIFSATFVNRLSDGVPLGLVESALLTRVRTAAVSALAIRHLLPEDPRAVTLLGAGAQAETHVEMLQALFPSLQRIHLWNRSTGRRDRLMAQTLASSRIPIEAHDHLDDAVESTDVIVSCTSSPEPIIVPTAVKPGRLIIQVGFHEAAFETIAASDCVTVDLWGDFSETSAKSLFQMYRAGLFKAGDVSADLKAILLDGWRPPPDASVYFSSFGLNIFDIALAARLLRHAKATGVGTLLPFV